MPREYSFEVRERAEELYIIDGLTYEQVARETGVSVAQIQRWASQGGWPERRREYRQALSDIKRKTVILRRELIDKALHSLDPQDVYAVARLEAATARSDIRNAKSETPMEEPPREIRTPQEAVEALEEAVERKLNAMLAGDVDLAGIRDLKKALDLIEEMKKRHLADGIEDERRGLSDEAVEEIRRKILGLQV